MRLSRIDQHTKDEPCAKQRALLGVPPAVPQAFLEVSDLRTQFLASHLQYVQSEVPYYNTAGAARSNIYIWIYIHKPVLLIGTYNLAPGEVPIGFGWEIVVIAGSQSCDQKSKIGLRHRICSSMKFIR